MDFEMISGETRRELLEMFRGLVSSLERGCRHEFIPLTEKELNDSRMCIGAVCLICGDDFGWRCKESPDEVCHYISTRVEGKRGVYLLGGRFYTNLNNAPDEDYETYDCCLFCGEPDERK